MSRKQIYLQPDQDRRLRALARRRGRTESQLVREGVDKILNEPTASGFDPEAWKKELAFIDSLIRKGPIKGKRIWKREDLYGRR
jgi:hypothetical protein